MDLEALKKQRDKLDRQIALEQQDIERKRKEQKCLEHYNEDIAIVKEMIEKQCSKSKPTMYYAMVGGKVWKSKHGSSLFVSEKKVIATIKSSIKGCVWSYETPYTNSGKIVDEMIKDGIIIIKEIKIGE